MRITTKQENGEYTIVHSQEISAIKKLGRIEDMYDALVKSNEEASGKMAVLKEKGDTKSVTFKEIMIKKLNNTNMLDMLKIYTME